MELPSHVVRQHLYIYKVHYNCLTFAVTHHKISLVLYIKLIHVT